MAWSSHRAATVIVLLHAVVATVHGMAHRGAGVGLSALGNAYVALVIVAGPFVALGVLRSHPAKGALVLAATMAGALVFGAWNHFVVASPDHVDHVVGPWRGMFRATAVGLVVTEVMGMLVGVWLLRGGGPPGRAQRPSPTSTKGAQ